MKGQIIHADFTLLLSQQWMITWVRIAPKYPLLVVQGIKKRWSFGRDLKHPSPHVTADVAE